MVQELLTTGKRCQPNVTVTGRKNFAENANRRRTLPGRIQQATDFHIFETVTCNTCESFREIGNVLGHD